MYGRIWSIYGHIWLKKPRGRKQVLVNFNLNSLEFKTQGPKMNRSSVQDPNAKHIPYMSIYDHIWTYMDIYGPYMVHIWPYMGIYGHIWTYMAIYGPYMFIYGPYMAIYGHKWTIYGHIWP